MMMMMMNSSDSGGQTAVSRASFTFFFFASDCARSGSTKPSDPTDYGTVRNYLCSVVVGVPVWVEYRTVFLFLAGDFVRRKSHRMRFDMIGGVTNRAINLADYVSPCIRQRRYPIVVG